MNEGGHQGLPAVSLRLERAIRLATRGHYFQFRKRPDGAPSCDPCAPPLPHNCVPYVAHLMSVVAILSAVGVGERVLAAAVLHDYLEDVPDPDGEETIRQEAGGDVLALVREVTEDKRDHMDSNLTWAVRKAEQLEAVTGMSEEAVLIKAADLLHNLFSLAVDLADSEDSASVWGRFNAGREQQLEYFARAVDALGRRLGSDHQLVRHLVATLESVRTAGPGVD